MQLDKHLFRIRSMLPPSNLSGYRTASAALIRLDSVQCFTSPPTQYRLYGRRFLQVKRPNQHWARVWSSMYSAAMKNNHTIWTVIMKHLKVRVQKSALLPLDTLIKIDQQCYVQCRSRPMHAIANAIPKPKLIIIISINKILKCFKGNVQKL